MVTASILSAISSALFKKKERKKKKKEKKEALNCSLDYFSPEIL